MEDPHRIDEQAHITGKPLVIEVADITGLRHGKNAKYIREADITDLYHDRGVKFIREDGITEVHRDIVQDRNREIEAVYKSHISEQRAIPLMGIACFKPKLLAERWAGFSLMITGQRHTDLDCLLRACVAIASLRGPLYTSPICGA